VSKGSAADRAGIRDHDILKRTASLQAPDGFLGSCMVLPSASGRATLEVWRGGRWQGIAVTPD
jgi:hypothetical protein